MEVARIPAGNRLKSYRTARSAFPAVGLDPAGSCRESGKAGLEWRESRARTTSSPKVPEARLAHVPGSPVRASGATRRSAAPRFSRCGALRHAAIGRCRPAAASPRPQKAVSAGSGGSSGKLRAAGSPRIDDHRSPRGTRGGIRPRGAESAAPSSSLTAPKPPRPRRFPRRNEHSPLAYRGDIVAPASANALRSRSEISHVMNTHGGFARPDSIGLD